MTSAYKQRLRIGFTGSRKGLTDEQRVALSLELQEQAQKSPDKELEVHHGDAIGADAEFHEICQKLSIRVVLHPPVVQHERAHCSDAADCRPAAHFSEQSESIVNSTELLIAAPNGWKEQLRGSGTWMTIRRARKAAKTIVLCYPDGTRETEVEE
ncbi:MAG: hypothetical protein K8T91_27525 [Planctomycetes bacterium]|nr:hypothetical protein [Planctomycetota bacterium]